MFKKLAHMGVFGGRAKRKKVKNEATSNSSLLNFRNKFSERPKWKVFRKKEVVPIPTYQARAIKTEHGCSDCACGNTSPCKQRVTPRGVTLHYPQKKSMFYRFTVHRSPYRIEPKQKSKLNKGVYKNTKKNKFYNFTVNRSFVKQKDRKLKLGKGLFNNTKKNWFYNFTVNRSFVKRKESKPKFFKGLFNTKKNKFFNFTVNRIEPKHKGKGLFKNAKKNKLYKFGRSRSLRSFEKQKAKLEKGIRNFTNPRLTPKVKVIRQRKFPTLRLDKIHYRPITLKPRRFF